MDIDNQFRSNRFGVLSKCLSNVFFSYCAAIIITLQTLKVLNMSITSLLLKNILWTLIIGNLLYPVKVHSEEAGTVRKGSNDIGIFQIEYFNNSGFSEQEYSSDDAFFGWWSYLTLPVRKILNKNIFIAIKILN